MEKSPRAKGGSKRTKSAQYKRWPFSFKANFNPFQNDSRSLQPSTERKKRKYTTEYTRSYCNPFSILLRPTRNQFNDEQASTNNAKTITKDYETVKSNFDLPTNTSDTREEQGTVVEKGWGVIAQGKMGSRNSSDSEIEVPKLLTDRVMAVPHPNTGMQTSFVFSPFTTEIDEDNAGSNSATEKRPEKELKVVCARVISGSDEHESFRTNFKSPEDSDEEAKPSILKSVESMQKHSASPQREENTRVNFCSWDSVEHRQFLNLYSIYGPDFEKISKFMSNRNSLQVEAYAYCSFKGESLRYWSCKEYENFVEKVPQRWIKNTEWSKEEVKERIQQKSDLVMHPTGTGGLDDYLLPTTSSFPECTKVISEVEPNVEVTQQRKSQGKNFVSNRKNGLLREIASFNLPPLIQDGPKRRTRESRKRQGYTVSFSEPNLNSNADVNDECSGNDDKECGKQEHRRSLRTKKMRIEDNLTSNVFGNKGKSAKVQSSLTLRASKRIKKKARKPIRRRLSRKATRRVVTNALVCYLRHRDKITPADCRATLSSDVKNAHRVSSNNE